MKIVRNISRRMRLLAVLGVFMLFVSLLFIGSSDFHTVTVLAVSDMGVFDQSQIVRTPPSGLSVAGPAEGPLGKEATFVASLIDGTTPVTYEWRVTDMPTQIVQVNDLNHTVSFTWTTYGRKYLTVIARNPEGVLTDTLFIDVQPLEIDLDKQVSPAGSVSAGAILNYVLTFTNTDIVPLTGNILTDRIPLNTTFLDGQAGGQLSNGVLTWHIDDVPLNTKKTVSFRVQVDKPLTVGAEIANRAYFYSDQTGTLLSNEVVNTLALKPDFGLSYKTASGGATVVPGDSIVYTVVYTNGGTEDAFNVFIRDALSEQLAYVDGGQYDTKTGEVQFDVGGVGVGVSGTVSFTAKVKDTASGGTIINNSAVISSSQTELYTTNVVTKMILAPKLELYKTVYPSGALTPGTIITYTIMYTNSGSKSVSDVVLVDPLPEGFICQTSTGVRDEDSLRWNLGTLNPGDHGAVTLVGWVDEGVGELRNQSRLEYAQGETVMSNLVTNSVSSSAMVVHKQVSPSGTIEIGDIVTYTLTYTNTGNSDISRVYLVDPLPKGTTYLNGGIYISSTGVIRFPLSTLPKGNIGSVTFSAVVNFEAGNTLTNVTQFFYDQYYPVDYVTDTPLKISGPQSYGPLGGKSSGRQYVAQSFIATAPRFHKAGIYIYGRAVPYPSLRVQVCADNAGQPDTSQLLVQGDWVTNSTMDGQYYFAEPSGPVDLEVGKQYWVVAEFDAVSDGSVGVRYAEEDIYPDGDWAYSTDGTSWTPAPSSDTDLNIWVVYQSPPQSNQVENEVVAPEPRLSVSPDTLGLVGVLGDGYSEPRLLHVENSALGAFNWSATKSASWLVITPTSGTTPAVISVTSSVTGLVPGVYTSTIIVTGEGEVLHSPQTVTVNLKVTTGNIYLPVVLRRYPPLPDPPTLNPINNNDLGTYEVTWDVANYALSYELQEAKSSDFSDAKTVYAGDGLLYAIVDPQRPTLYYYRVRGINDLGNGEWSTAQVADVRWESNSNNFYSISDGPLYPEPREYYGYPDDEDDYYKFLLTETGKFKVNIKNFFAGEGTLLLYYSASGGLDLCSYIPLDKSGTSSGEIDMGGCTGAPGTYYIRVYTNPKEGVNNSSPYTLKVSEPY